MFCAFPISRSSPSERATRIPDALSDVGAAVSAQLGVAINGLAHPPPMLGEYVVVSGLGAIGMFTAYLARRAASKLILVEPNAVRARGRGTDRG